MQPNVPLVAKHHHTTLRVKNNRGVDFREILHSFTYAHIIYRYTSTYIRLIHIIIFHILFVSFDTLLFVLVTVYYHHIAELCLSYHVKYYIHFICIYLSFSFMFHACKYLRSGHEKELYIPKGTLIVRESDLYLYVSEGTITVRDSDLCMTQTGPL